MTQTLKWLGRIEGGSFLLLLLVAMPLKYYADMPIGVKVLGPIHGVLFLGYCAFALNAALDQKWPLSKHLLAYAAAVLPFGTWVFERKYL